MGDLRGLRRELDKLRGRVWNKGIVLEDGTVHRFDQGETSVELFTYASACICADADRRPRPEEVPEIINVVARAKDRRAALTEVNSHWQTGAPLTLAWLDLEALIERGEIVHVPLSWELPVVEAVEEEAGVADD